MLKTQASRLSELGLYPHVAKQLYPPPPNCILHLAGYPPGGATITDHSGQGNTGTLSLPTWTRLPSGLWALNFDGTDDNVYCAKSVTELLAGLTLLAWVNPTDQSKNSHIISDFRTDTNTSAIMTVQDVAATSTWRLGGGLKGIATAWAFNQATTTTRTYGVWHQVAMTWDGTTQTFYIDGYADGTVAYSDTTLQDVGVNVTHLGSNSLSAPSDLFKGQIALVRICSAALSTPQILLIFQQERHLFGV